MTWYMIVIETIPGDRRSEEYFSYECEDVDQAWTYARSKWRQYGALSRIREVREIPAVVR